MRGRSELCICISPTFYSFRLVTIRGFLKNKSKILNLQCILVYLQKSIITEQRKNSRFLFFCFCRGKEPLAS